MRKPQDQRILSHNDYCCSHKEIARELGVSPARVQQIERKALDKLRARLERSGKSFNTFLPDLYDRDDCPIEPEPLDVEGLY